MNKTTVDVANVAKREDLVAIAKMGATKVASVFYYLLNPSGKSEEALQYLIRIKDLNAEELDMLRQFCNQHEKMLNSVKALNKIQYKEFCDLYGKEVIDFFVYVMQQV